MSTFIILDSTSQAGKNLSKSLVNANPEAGDGALESFADQLNALTTNNYRGAYRVTKTDLDGEPSPTGTQVTPTLTLSSSTATFAQVETARKNTRGLYIDITYNGDGTLYVPDKSWQAQYGESTGEPVLPVIEELQNVEGSYPTCAGKVVYVDGQPKLYIIPYYYYDGEQNSLLSVIDDDGYVILPQNIIVYATETPNSKAVQATFTITKE